MRQLWREFHHAVRSLSRHPTLFVVAVTTVALGTAATTTVLSVRSALIDRPLAVSEPRDLRLLDEARSGVVAQALGVDAMPYARYLAYREALAETFSGLAAERFRMPGGFSLTAPEGAVSAHGHLVSENYFDVLGVQPVLGRFFSEPDEASVVLGERFWRQRFSGNAGVLGQTVRIDSRAYTLIGVVPEAFQGTIRGIGSDVWIPFEAYHDRDDASFDGWVTVFGRLRSGMPVERAREVVAAAAVAIPPLQPQTTVRGADLPPLTGLPPGAAQPVGAFLGLLLATGVLVLMIAAANIAGMLLARGVARRRETSVRLALGAGRWRVAWQSFAEALVLFGSGGAFGVWLGGMAARAIQTLRVPIGLDIVVDFAPDPRVVLLGLIVTALVGGAVALVPSLQSARGDVLDGLRAGAGGGGREALGWRLFVRAQVALSVLLLVTAGLFARTLQRAASVDLGFDHEGIFVAQIDLAPHGYDAEGADAFFRELRSRVEALPAVQGAAVASTVLLGPFYGRSTNDMTPADDDAEGVRVNSAYSVVEPGYLDMLEIDVIRGRDFDATDVPGAASAAIVNETLAERMWPGQDPIGRRLTGGGTFEVVGVVRDGKYAYVGEGPTPYVFRAYAQSPRTRMTLHVRSAREEGAVATEVREIVRGLDPNVALQNVARLSSIVELTLFPQRFAAWLVGAFGLMGLLFAGTGVYGILHFNVARRTREVGVRVALGAHPARVFREMLGYGAALAGVAVVVGLLGAAVVTRLVGGLMIGVTQLDPVTYVGAAALLMAVAVAASAIPARRATQVDPAEALRAE